MPTPVYTFSPNTTIRASEVNANFALLLQCLATTGGTLTGTLNSRSILPTADNTYPLGNGSLRWSDLRSVLATVGTLSVDTLKVNDTDDSHGLQLAVGSNLTADRVLTFTTGDAARTITINGNPTLNDWFDQSVKTTASVTHASIVVNGATSGTQAQNTFAGTHSGPGSVNTYGTVFGTSVSPAVNDIGAVVLMQGTLVEAGSGTHPLLASLFLNPPTITAGGAATTIGATLYIAGPPSGAFSTGPFAMWVNAGESMFVAGVREHSRAYNMGDTQTRSFTAGNYTGVGGTWTVQSGDVTSESWRLVGDTLWFNLRLANTQVDGALNKVRIALPGFTVQETVIAPALLGNTASDDYTPNAVVEAISGNSYIEVYYYNLAIPAAASDFNVAFQLAVKVSG